MHWISTYSGWIYFLIIILAIGIAYWSYWAPKTTVYTQKQRVLLSTLRFLSVLLIGFLIFSPMISHNKLEEVKPQILVCMDQSKSVGGHFDGAPENIYSEMLQGIAQVERQYEVDTILFGSSLRKGMQAKFDDDETDMSSLSSYISDRYYESNLKHVLILTDGYNNKGEAPFQRDYLLEVPVSFLAIGDTLYHPDFAVSLLQGPQTVLAENEVVINYELSCKNSLSKSATVKIVVDGAVQKTETISFKYSDDVIAKQYAHKLSSAGHHSFCVEITSQEKEENLANNKRCISVEVSQNKYKVALCYESVHPDIGAIKRALQGYKNISVSSYRGVPASISEDIIIAHNIAAAANIKKLHDADKPIWIINGIYSNPGLWEQQYSTLSTIACGQDLLPSLNASFDYFDKQFVDLSLLPQLPALVTSGKGLRINGSNQSLFTSGNVGLMSYYYGSPSIILENGEGLWRWKMQEMKTQQKSPMFDELARQNVQFLRPNSMKNKLVVKINKQLFSIGEPIVWTAQYYDKNAKLDNAGDAKLTIKGNGIDKKLNMNKSNQGYALATEDLPPGDYNYTLVHNQGGSTQSQSGRFAIQNTDIEEVHTSANMDLLSQISLNYGGDIYTADNLESFWSKIKEQNAPIQIRNENNIDRLVDMPWVLVLLAFLLALEWVLRKWWGSL